MNNPNFKQQRGAVLAFSLVMLLLLTLAGTRMIQQNKQQLAMANNMRLSAQEFANAESILPNPKATCSATRTTDDCSMVMVGTTCTITVKVIDTTSTCTDTTSTCTITATVNGIKIESGYDMNNGNSKIYWKEIIQ